MKISKKFSENKISNFEKILKIPNMMLQKSPKVEVENSEMHVGETFTQWKTDKKALFAGHYGTARCYF